MCVFSSEALSQCCQHYLLDKMHTSLSEGSKGEGNPGYRHEVPLCPLGVHMKS